MITIGRIITAARGSRIGGPLGSLLDRVEQLLPRRLSARAAVPPEESVAFTIAVVALGAKMAKADVDVTRDGVAAFREVFQMPPGEAAHLRLVFALARRSTAG